MGDVLAFTISTACFLVCLAILFVGGPPWLAAVLMALTVFVLWLPEEGD